MDYSIESLDKCTILKEIVACSKLKDEELRFIKLTMEQKHLLEAELHQALDSIQGCELMGVKIEVDNEN